MLFVENLDKYKLNAPIPGMSLTTEPGSRPWEQPPKLTTVAETVSMYAEKLSDPEAIGNAMDAARQNVPLESLARILITGHVMKGIHTIDVGMLVMPVIIEMLKSVAEINDIGYVITDSDKEGTPVTDKIAKEAIDEVKAAATQVVEEERPSSKKGLMAKGEE